jgi:hypothetical protein
MKSAGKTFGMAAVVVAIAGFVNADCPDFTDKLEYLCNPNATVVKWQGTNLAKRASRTTMTIYPYEGKLYTSGGEWNANTGPANAVYHDIQTLFFCQI